MQANDARDRALLAWAAQRTLASSVVNIVDFNLEPTLLLRQPDGSVREKLLQELSIDTRSAAALLRDAYAALIERAAERMRATIAETWGVDAAGFAQALRDYEALAASSASAGRGSCRSPAVVVGG